MINIAQCSADTKKYTACNGLYSQIVTKTDPITPSVTYPHKQKKPGFTARLSYQSQQIQSNLTPA